MLEKLDGSFDFILVDGVWHRLNTQERHAAIKRLLCFWRKAGHAPSRFATARPEAESISFQPMPGKPFPKQNHLACRSSFISRISPAK